MTNKQKFTVDLLTSAIKSVDFIGHAENYEFKEYTITEHDYGTVELYCVTGLKGDEGTMAEVLCRRTRQIFIGKNGGLTSYNNQKKNNKGATLHAWSDVVYFGYMD